MLMNGQMVVLELSLKFLCSVLFNFHDYAAGWYGSLADFFSDYIAPSQIVHTYYFLTF